MDKLEITVINHINKELIREVVVDYCQNDGVGLSCTAGNHDPFLSPMLSCALADGRVLVVHGHTIHRKEPRPLVPGQVLEHGIQQGDKVILEFLKK